MTRLGYEKQMKVETPFCVAKPVVPVAAELSRVLVMLLISLFPPSTRLMLLPQVIASYLRRQQALCLMTTLIILSKYFIGLESKSGAENGPGYLGFYIELSPEVRQLPGKSKMSRNEVTGRVI
ncbi:hypothetical protein BHYA_0058g00020 [Botrytis hyacinthi]|uniref:Uncharacterized protein n=1 Tax=Botrytis hyacinthi TaxID=278943 RepID=A0A4Z1GV44_9HELO|nr:hypothetical protein BHYA_0058g00020 [Botrytis hyacinthi]